MSSRMSEYNVQLVIGESRYTFRGRVPQRPIRVADVLPLLYSLLEPVIHSATRRLRAEGKEISCRAGCGACCRQLVPVSESEAVRLLEVAGSLPADVRDRVWERFCQARERLQGAGLVDRLLTMAESRDVEAGLQLGVEYFRLGLPCPFLENESCGIYEHRPMICRQYLVTSPAVDCSDPRPGRIDEAPLPIRLSRLLFRFEDGKGDAMPYFVPLTLSQLVVERREGKPLPVFAGPELFEAFLRRVQTDLEATRREG